jgi:N-methylhydantoinase A
MNIAGTDIGGTFTDLVGCIDGRIVTSKTSTIPANPAEGVVETLRLAGCAIPDLAEILHGSTTAINTVLERKGARTALLTTKGFRDIYAIGRGNRIEAFNLFFHRPKPLAERSLSFEVPERMNAKGEVLLPLDESVVENLLPALRKAGVEAIAVCLLHAWANPAHERRLGTLLRKALPDVFVTLSHEILREYREYERTSTTVLNAYVGPRVKNYLRRLEERLERDQFAGKIQIMRSNGGVMSVGLAAAQPVAMMESGPVAGMIAAGRLARDLSLDRCIGFDMGGTTAKTTLISDGVPAIEAGYVIGGAASGQPMQLPVVDIVEVGAGGGSIAWIDADRGLHVGPQSAGADPGPACYGKGNDRPVVTDANLLLGRINPERFLNGAMRLNTALAERAIASKLAAPLDLGVRDAALGILRIADAAMSLAVRAVSVNKGVDPRDTVLIAFGGGGPLHACAIAREIFIPKVVVPKLPGTFSALGMLMAAWRQDFVRTLIGRLGNLDANAVNTVFDDLTAAGEEQITREGIARTDANFAFFADLRYAGQEHAIPVPLAGPQMMTGDVTVLRGMFHDEHAKRYSQSAPDESMECVSLRLVVTSPRKEGIAEKWLNEAWRADGPVQETRREVIFDDSPRPVEARVLWRPSLPAGMEIAGPAVIEEPNATTLLHPGDDAVIGDSGHITISIGDGRRV